MKSKQEHIEEVEQVIWNWLQSHYQESCYTTELGKFTDALCDFWKIYNDNKDENKQLKAKNKVLGDGVEKAFTNGFTDGRKVYEKDIRRAKIDVLNELRERYASSGSVDSSWTTIIFVDDIDEMIEELKK